jgi:hypothetical protein
LVVSFAPRRSELFLHCHRRSIVDLVWRHRSIRGLLGVSKRIVSEKPSFIIPDDSGQLTQPFQRSNGGSALHTAMGPAIFIPPETRPPRLPRLNRKRLELQIVFTGAHPCAMPPLGLFCTTSIICICTILDGLLGFLEISPSMVSSSCRPALQQGTG